jgi:hypothetical protein
MLVCIKCIYSHILYRTSVCILRPSTYARQFVHRDNPRQFVLTNDALVFHNIRCIEGRPFVKKQHIHGSLSMNLSTDFAVLFVFFKWLNPALQTIFSLPEIVWMDMPLYNINLPISVWYVLNRRNCKNYWNKYYIYVHNFQKVYTSNFEI